MAPWLLTLLAAEPTLVSLAVTVEDPAADPWVAPRLTQLWREQLAPSDILVAPNGPPVAVRLEVTAAEKITLRTQWGADHFTATRPATEIEILAEEAAQGLAGLLKRSFVPRGRDGTPLQAHRLLGRAQARLDAGELRHAALMFERAQDLRGVGWLEAAHVGRAQAEVRLDSGADRAALAEAAQERAQAGIRGKRWAEASGALVTFLRYTPARARRWAQPLALDGLSIIARSARWTLAGEVAWDFDSRSGVLAPPVALPHVVGLVGDDWLTLKGRDLARWAGSKRLWSLVLPAAPEAAGPAGVVQAGGMLGVLGERSVAWIDVSLGKVAQVAEAIPLASGPGGVLARMQAEVALLRPGQKAPAWRAEVGAVTATALTRDRALLLTEAGLVLLRTHDGRPVRPPLPLPGARLVGGDGRYFVFESDEQVIVDVLGGELTARLKGPGKAVDAVTSGEGLAILFEAGDLLFVDRDGKLLDRAWAPGRPQKLFKGHPEAPGPVVASSAGLFAFAEVAYRDVDALLDLARVRQAEGQAAEALRLADAVARWGAGRAQEAERLRASLLQAQPKTQAEARAAAPMHQPLRP